MARFIIFESGGTMQCSITVWVLLGPFFDTGRVLIGIDLLYLLLPLMTINSIDKRKKYKLPCYRNFIGRKLLLYSDQFR